MRKQILNALMAGMLVFGAGGAWAQDSAPLPADTPAPAAAAPAAVEQPATIPAPEVNVNVPPSRVDVQVQQAPAAAPPSTVIIEKSQPSTHTSTNVSRSETTVVQPPDSAFNPWLAVGIGLAVLIVILFIAMAFTDRSGRTTSVTTVR